MVLISCIQFMAIFTFTLIKDRLFSLKFDVKIDHVLAKSSQEAEMFIYNIDCTIKNIYDVRNKLGQLKPGELRERFDLDTWNDFMNVIEFQQRQSCFEAFMSEPFYN